METLKTSGTYKFIASILYRIRTWSRRTIWGDRLFLRFQGPTTLLIQSRAARVNDVLTAADVNEIADTPPGAVREALSAVADSSRMGIEGVTTSAAPTSSVPRSQPKLTVASVSKDGKVTFDAVKDPENVKKEI